MLDNKPNNMDELAQPSLLAKPRLSMKYLLILIQDIQDQNQLMLQRVARIEQQLSEYSHSRDEIAAAGEQMRDEAEVTTQVIESQDSHSQEIRISRAERHAPPKKKSFRLWR